MKLNEKLYELEIALKTAQNELAKWVTANQNLNQAAAEERARLQGYGNGLGGMLLGSKYRSTVRRAASSSRASIAKQVSESKAIIVENKQRLQAEIKFLKEEIKTVKELLKQEKGRTKKSQSSGGSKTTLDQLAQLSKMYEDGLLSEDEFSIAKRKILMNEDF